MAVFDQKRIDTPSPPLLTVAMPVYNAGPHLRLAVLSIVRQTFSDWELLIVDDGSTDNALQGIADISDARIRILCDGKNKGLAARLNECIDLAHGRYLARMDQDDVSYPERFSQQIAALQKDSALDLVAVGAVMIDENNKVTGIFPRAIDHDEICAKPWRGFYFPHPTWMGKIEWFRKYRYAEPGPYFCEDQELLLRSYEGSKFTTIDEILFAYRVRGKTNWPKLAKTRRTVLTVQIRYFSELDQWRYAVLAIAAYLVKTGRDLFKKLNTENKKYECAGVDDVVVSRWNVVLVGIAQEPKFQ